MADHANFPDHDMQDWASAIPGGERSTRRASHLGGRGSYVLQASIAACHGVDGRRTDAARSEFERAAAMTGNEAERTLLLDRAASCCIGRDGGWRGS